MVPKKNTNPESNRLKLIIGSILFMFIVVMHAIYEVNIWLVAIPGALMGIDPTQFLANKK
jgi:hypothetical protein